ncbi:MAG: FapA family protein [Phycisphaerales bacterium]|jgi:hypothetical protein|nr:FapA family protein [Phycisphaerales bacterium]
MPAEGLANSSMVDRLAEAVVVHLSDDKLRAEVSLVHAEGLDLRQIDEALIMARLSERGVQINAPVRTRVSELAKRCASGLVPAAGEMALMAEGIAPMHGTPGRLVWAEGCDPGAKASKTAAQTDDASPADGNSPDDGDAEDAHEGDVDHYVGQQYTFVGAGVTIARLHPPGECTDGQDVCGGTIPAIAGREIEIKPDDSILLRADGQVITSKAGVIDWQAPKLRVTQTLTISGNVDFSTGHVEFPGAVIVSRMIADRFRVTTATDLVVHGLVEGAKLRVGRDAHLRGGMAAKEVGSLRAARDVRAKYLNNAKVHVGRDLGVDKELVNSSIVVGRSVIGPVASITGGSLRCASTVEVAEVGSAIGVATEIVLGSIPALERLLVTAMELRPKMTKGLERIESQLEPLRRFKGKLSGADAERMTELEFERRPLLDRLGILDQKIEKLRETLAARTKVDLLVHSRIHPRVRLTTPLYTVDFTKTVAGPVRIGVGAKGEPELQRPYGQPMETPIHAVARVRKVDGLTAGESDSSRAAA